MPEGIVTLNKFGVPTAGNTSGSGILMPKLKYRFRITFDENFGELPVSESLVITQNVQNITRPKLNHEEVILDSYNSRMYIQGKHSWDPITVTVRDDLSNGTSRAVGRQLQRQFNHFQQRTPASGSDYKFRTSIEVLDGTNADAVEWWVCEGCFIQGVDYSDGDYTATDPVQITMTIRFDNATQYDAQGAFNDPSFPTAAGALSDTTGNA